MNPVAGISGIMGLKGFDEEETVKKTIALGAKSVALFSDNFDREINKLFLLVIPSL